MKRFFVVVILTTFWGILSQTYSQWSKHTIDSTLPNATFIAIADIDEDGDLDMVANGNPYVRWYQNNSPDTTWTPHDIDNSLYGAVGLAIVDIDGDDTLDVVAAGYNSNDIRWYKNEGGTPIHWHQYIIDDDYEGAEGLIVGDIDADGDSDVVVTGTIVDQLAWFENKLPDTNWKKHIIDDDLPGANGVDVGDIDGDDDLDVVVTGLYANDVRWYENNLPDTIWNPITIVENLSEAFFARIADIDGDNTLDVVATGQYANKLVWCKNENAGQTWTEYPIDVNLDGARIMNVADIDGDDTPDVVATAYTGDYVVAYWNQHPNWPQSIIDTDLNGANYVCTADINDDDILDVVATGRLAGGGLYWYEQEPVWVKIVEFFPKYLIPTGDTLFIKAHIVNTENHSVSVNAKIKGETVSFSDSILLYDDGMHGDENPNDNIWGNKKWLSGLEKDIYNIEIYTHDLSSGTIIKYNGLNYITNIGPIVFDNYELLQVLPSLFSFKLYLRNDDSTNMVPAVTAEISTIDTNVTNISAFNNTVNIAPGQVSSPSLNAVFTQNNPDSIDFKVQIFSNNSFFWSDSFRVNIPPSGIAENETNLPIEYTLNQNYPNPFNPSTSIEFNLPKSGKVSLKIFNILGEEVTTLVSDRLSAGSYSYEWDASNLASGVYLYRLQAGDNVKTKKMIIMK
jgi:hypothetical protein